MNDSLKQRLAAAQDLVDDSKAALERTRDSEYDPLWAPFSNLLEAHRELLRDYRELASQLEDQQQQADGLREEVELLRQNDPLTGLLSHHRFMELLDHEYRRGVRSKSPLSLMLIDLNRFHAYNDHYGHVAGDVCLQRVSGALSNALKRPQDLLGRYAGEEFICLAPDTDPGGARTLAEHLRQAVRDLDIPHAASDAAEIVTVSVGLITVIPNQERKPFSLVERVEELTREAGHDHLLAVEG